MINSKPNSQLKSLFSPEEQLGSLFSEVQLSSVFPDSKTFVDCVPIHPPEEILKAYETAKNEPNFNLKDFIHQNFELPVNPVSPDINTNVPITQHIQELWPILTRKPQPEGTLSTLIPLPNDYIVPGGRFREVYYWDSYFTMLGLQKSGLANLIQDIIDNFTYLINFLGHIPNGNREYYISRSQPPFYSLMLEILAQEKGKEVLTKYGSALMREYQFWMNGAENLTEINNSYRRVVRMPDGSILNRYWDDKDTPRPESYLEDVTLSKKTKRDSKELYRDIRAAAESGWDFSSRWFADAMDMTTIRTTLLIPIDLNCLIYHMEMTIAKIAELQQDQKTEKLFIQKASSRKETLLKYCWSEKDNYFYDYDFVNGKTSGIPTLAAAFPLYFNIATNAQAASVEAKLETDFLKPGGLVTTLTNTTQQWDAPNGWAPLQWISVQGLINYDHKGLADNIIKNWTSHNIKVYNKTGKLMEKYNVEAVHLEGGGGEYPTQDGFGWTNGVLLALLSEVKDKN